MSILDVGGYGMGRKKDVVLVPLSVKLPEALVATLRRLADEQGRKLQVVAAQVVAAGLLAQEKSK
jgi:hypothetical protein